MSAAGILPSWSTGKGLSSGAETRPRRLRGPSEQRAQAVRRRGTEARSPAADSEFLAEQREVS